MTRASRPDRRSGFRAGRRLSAPGRWPRSSRPAPDGLPLLSGDAAVRPGAVLPLAAVLAGERPSARPRCVHPLIARLAEAVEQHLTGAGLAGLARTAPDLIGTADLGYRVDPVLMGLLAVTAPRLLNAEAPREEMLRAARRRARHVGHHTPHCQLWLLVTRRGYRRAAGNDIAGLVSDPLAQWTDAALHELLGAVLAACPPPRRRPSEPQRMRSGAQPPKG